MQWVTTDTDLAKLTTICLILRSYSI